MSDTMLNEKHSDHQEHLSEGDHPLPSQKPSHFPLGTGTAEFAGRHFGTIKGYDDQGNHILIPQPSNSPNDPLNWSWAYKNYIAVLVCSLVLMCNITGAGPSIAIIQQAIEFTGIPPAVQRTAYLFSSFALANGVGLFVWVPFTNKYGKRPTYIIALTIYFAGLFWCGFAKSYGVELAGRIVTGLAAGAGECLGALTINDIFFAHQRGTYMAYYNVFLSCGAAIGLITDGAITQHLGWRYIYYIDVAFTGALLVLVIFTFPETTFLRTEMILSGKIGKHTDAVNEDDGLGGEHMAKHTFAQKLRMFTGVYTKESFLKMLIRPFGIVFLPAVFYSMMVFSVTIGFLVAVTSNVAPAYEGTFGFTTQQTGFLFFGALIGSLIGIPAGGQLGDWVADRAARRNGGIREPEHRLPAMIISIITGPLSLVLYGLCIQNRTNWFVGCLGLSLVNFTICAATNITLVYSLDCYKPIAGEVVTATLGGKAMVGFGLGFGTNLWVDNEGYLNAYGEMASISAFFLLLTVPMYFFGKRLRNASAKWLPALTRWDDDRDDIKID